MKASPSLIFPCLLALSVATASAQLISYTDRSKVDVLNAWNASLAVSGTRDPFSQLNADQGRFYIEDSAAPNAVGRVTSSNPAATMDFGTTRNVKTVTVYENLTNFGFTAAVVETSNDGVSWTPQSNVVTNPTSTTNTVITLNSAVDARFVRVTPTSFENSTWYFNTIRAFGDTGTMAGDPNLTIVANGAFSSAQSISAIGTISQINSSQMIAPATSPYSRQLLFNMGNSEGFKFDLGQTFAVDEGMINLSNIVASGGNPLTMTLSGSLDGTSFSPLYTKTYTSNVSTFDLFNYSFTQANARYLEVTFSTATATNITVSDFAFYQTTPVPEPTTFALLGVAGAAFALRRRSRNLA